MADVVSKEKRSQMMAGIKGKDTKPEVLIRLALHRRGFRYRKNKKGMPGTPDLVFRKRKAIIQVHGCFFHGHGCHLFKWPQGENAVFWKNKITRNQEVDSDAIAKLQAAGWRTGVVWECALKGKRKLPFSDVIDACQRWLLSDEKTLEISGAI